jgi:hypothetical protein
MFNAREGLNSVSKQKDSIGGDIPDVMYFSEEEENFEVHQSQVSYYDEDEKTAVSELAEDDIDFVELNEDSELSYYQDQIKLFMRETEKFGYSVWHADPGRRTKVVALYQEVASHFIKVLESWGKEKPYDLFYEYFYFMHNKIIPLIAKRTNQSKLAVIKQFQFLIFANEFELNKLIPFILKRTNKTEESVRNELLVLSHDAKQAKTIKRMVMVNGICDKYMAAGKKLIKEAKLLQCFESKESKYIESKNAADYVSILESKLAVFKNNIEQCREDNERNSHYHPGHEYSRLVHQEVIPFIAEQKKLPESVVQASLQDNVFIPVNIKKISETDVFSGKMKMFIGGLIFTAGLALSFGILSAIFSVPMMVVGSIMFNSGRKTYCKGKANLIPFKVTYSVAPKSMARDSKQEVNSKKVTDKAKLSKQSEIHRVLSASKTAANHEQKSKDLDRKHVATVSKSKAPQSGSHNVSQSQSESYGSMVERSFEEHSVNSHQEISSPRSRSR